MTPKTLYILGPMTGYDDYNRAAFRAARERLTAAGHTVVCPDELDKLDPADGTTWGDYMRRDIPHLCRVQGAVALPGWMASKGATLEACIVNALGLPVYDYETMARIDPDLMPRPVYCLPA